MVRKVSRSSLARKDRQSFRKSDAVVNPAHDHEIRDHAPQPALSGNRSEKLSNTRAISANPQETAAYILEMSLALRNVANDSGLDFLAYLLDMAAEEADGLLQADKHHRSPVPRDEIIASPIERDCS